MQQHKRCILMVLPDTRNFLNKLSKELNKKHGGVFHHDYIIKKALEQMAEKEEIKI